MLVLSFYMNLILWLAFFSINTMLLRFIQLWAITCSYQLGVLAAISDWLLEFNFSGSSLWKPPISTNQGFLFSKKQLVTFTSIPLVSSILCVVEMHSVSYNITIPQCLPIFLFGSNTKKGCSHFMVQDLFR